MLLTPGLLTLIFRSHICQSRIRTCLFSFFLTSYQVADAIVNVEGEGRGDGELGGDDGSTGDVEVLDSVDDRVGILLSKAVGGGARKDTC